LARGIPGPDNVANVRTSPRASRRKISSCVADGFLAPPRRRTVAGFDGDFDMQ
jgi:hypothetical protein